MPNLNDIVYCTEEQLETMANGTPVSEHEYNENDLYITPLDDDIIVGADGSGTKVNDNNELIVDPTYIHDTVDTDITEAKTIAERAEVIARGRATAYIYDTVEDLETALADKEFVDSLVVGDNFYIRALEVPDYWWDGTTKQQLESEKPDLSGLVKDVQIDGTSVVADGTVNLPNANKTEAGVVKINYAEGITIGNSGHLKLNKATTSHITNRNLNMPITSDSYDFAVKAAMTDGVGDAWTDEEKAAARTRIGAVSSDDVTAMINNTLGVIENGYY